MCLLWALADYVIKGTYINMLQDIIVCIQPPPSCSETFVICSPIDRKLSCYVMRNEWCCVLPCTETSSDKIAMDIQLLAVMFESVCSDQDTRKLKIHCYTELFMFLVYLDSFLK